MRTLMVHPGAGSTEKRVSRTGFDVTPLTAEQKAAEAQKLSDFQVGGNWLLH